MPDTASFSSDSFEHDALLAGDADLLVEDKVTLKSGQNVVRGTVLGKLTADGKYVIADTSLADGSEDPLVIAADDCDASAADAECMVYIAGIFNETELTYGGADTADDVREALHDRGIYLRKGMAA